MIISLRILCCTLVLALTFSAHHALHLCVHTVCVVYVCVCVCVLCVCVVQELGLTDVTLVGSFHHLHTLDLSSNRLSGDRHWPPNACTTANACWDAQSQELHVYMPDLPLSWLTMLSVRM